MAREKSKIARAATVKILLALISGTLRLASGSPLEELVLRHGQGDRALTTSDSSTSLQLEPFEVCPEEATACYDDSVCATCVSESTPIDEEECRTLYPVLQETNVTECEDLAALICCKFDLVGDDGCRKDELTLDFWTCGLDSKNCTVTLPCSVGSNFTQSPMAAPSPSPIPGQTGPGTGSPTEAPTIVGGSGSSPSAYSTPAPAGSDVRGLENTPSPAYQTDLGSGISGAVGVRYPGSNGLVVYVAIVALLVGLQTTSSRIV